MTERVEAFEYDIDIVLLALLLSDLEDRLEAPVGLSDPLQIRNGSRLELACRRLLETSSPGCPTRSSPCSDQESRSSASTRREPQ